MYAVCNDQCHCSPTLFEPTCGSDGRAFMSPCFAGCANRTGDSFINCSCIDGGLGSAELGYCGGVCKDIGFFMVALFAFLFLIFMTNVPTTTVTLRAVPENQRSLAMGFGSFIFRLVGAIPGPVLGA